MRILVITDQFPPGHFGGMAQHAYHIARQLSQKHEVRVVLPRGHDPASHTAEKFAVEPVLTMRFPQYDFWKLRRLARAFRPDVVHVCTAGLADETLSREFPVVTRVVGNDFLRPWCGYNLPLRSLLYRLPGKGLKAGVEQWESRVRKARVERYLRASQTVVANSRFTQDKLNAIGIQSERVRTVVGGVDLDVFRPARDKAALRRKLGLPEQAMLVVSAGNVIEKKGMAVVIQALASLCGVVPHVHYVVVGAGPDMPRLRILSEKLHVTNRVIFAGPQSQPGLADYYQCSDLYVLASREETMGRTYFEAGACGLPVVGARVGGVPDVIGDGENGFLVDDPEDVVAIAECIRCLLANPSLREKMGAAGLKRAREEFSWTVVGSAFEEILIAAAKGSAGGD